MSRRFACVGVGAMLAAIVGCSSDSDNPASTDGGADAALAKIQIGVVVSLTGDLAAAGGPQQNAVRVAEQQINALGGILGRPVQFVIEDDKTDANVVKTLLNDFIAKKFPIVLGPTGSPAAVAGAPLTLEAKVPFISFSASTPGLTNAQPAKDRYFFRTAPSHASQAKALARLAKVDNACAKAAVIHADDAYGNPIADGISKKMTALGGAVAVDIKVPASVKANYDTEIAQVIAGKVDCQMIITFPDVGARYMRDFKRLTATDTSRDWKTFVNLGSNGLKLSGFLVSARDNPADPMSPNAADGMLLTTYDTNPPTQNYVFFKNLYTAVYPLKPDQTDLDPYASNAYDAAILAVLAIQKAGTTTDGVAIRDALFEVSRLGQAYGPNKLADALAAAKEGKDIDYDGASGSVDFDDYGDVVEDFVVWKVDKGAFVVHDRVKAADLGS